MLDKVPTILSAQEILDKAFLKANKLEVPDPDKYHRVRKTEERQMKAVADITAEALLSYRASFPTLENLPMYEQELLDILVGLAPLKKALANVDWARETIRNVHREVAGAMGRERTILGIQAQKRRFSGRCSSIVRSVDKDLAFLRHARDLIRLLPTIHPEYATVVIAGFPNVGKSSLLAAWTHARPQIAPYAFTTKNANVGHFDVTGPDGTSKVQVVDTPGLLDRPDGQRNAVERQAAAALRHTADGVLFLIDPSETSGCSMEEQERLLEQVRRDMVGVPILVAEAKCDLPRSVPATDRPRFSTLTGEGVEALREKVVEMVVRREPEMDVDPLEMWKAGRDPMFG
ncbi:MAG: NOG1 family protein [Thermoplasmatota archaeon]